MANIIIIHRELVTPRLERVVAVTVDDHIFRHGFQVQPSGLVLFQRLFHIGFQNGEAFVHDHVHVVGHEF